MLFANTDKLIMLFKVAAVGMVALWLLWLAGVI